VCRSATPIPVGRAELRSRRPDRVSPLPRLRWHTYFRACGTTGRRSRLSSSTAPTSLSPLSAFGRGGFLIIIRHSVGWPIKTLP
jgi:hypothetical protein